MTSNAVMVNGIYNFPGMGAMAAVQPYVGIGIGGAQVDFDGDSTDFEFAYQTMAGVSYAVNPNVESLRRGPVVLDGWRRILQRGRHPGEAGFDTIDLLVGAAYNF